MGDIKMITSKSVIKDLPFIEDKKVFRAVTMALWLIIDENCATAKGIKIAAKKVGVTATVTGKIVREAIPRSFKNERVRAAIASNPDIAAQVNLKRQRIIQEAKDEQHIASIMGEL